jgi:ABC-2 type transport system ATP-binding protein
VTIPVDGGRAAIAHAVRALDDLHIDVDDIGLRRPTLDEVFLTLTGAPATTDEDADTDATPTPTSGTAPAPIDEGVTTP